MVQDANAILMAWPNCWQHVGAATRIGRDVPETYLQMSSTRLQAFELTPWARVRLRTARPAPSPLEIQRALAVFEAFQIHTNMQGWALCFEKRNSM